MSDAYRLIHQASAYPTEYAPSAGRPGQPSAGVAVVACMDARLDVWNLLGLEEGEAHVIRNAGGLITEDALRSLVISQRALGTSEIILIHHTRCGMQGLDAGAFLASLEAETGTRPPWQPGGFDDVEQDVRASMAAIRSDPFLVSKQVRGFVFDVDDGTLREVA
jgi:carbonic anhydrase